ncbi:hypothetical protein [Natrinema salsiterrestre]|uniref:Glucodextranase N-terminal domain-containing protein n=1 Tax=Natrinema salsiterrestre TaxID=2950540 RepID=A0A9Q4L0F2_9EURY|nr:hypothetical protein [Natrinema salsiterrestre]MDF9745716.1 hypothetical protein [Natrinema salsiterrestre]
MTGLGALGGAEAVAADDVDIPLSARGDGWEVGVSAEQYDTSDQQGARLEDVYSGDRSNIVVDALDTVVYDGSVTRNTRADASSSEVNVTTSYVAEAYMSTTVPVADGTVDLYQMVLAAEDRPAILLESEATIDASGEFTFYTIATPTIGSDDGADNEAWLTDHDGYDVIVATHDGQYVAFAQRQDWRKEFDGQRIGTVDGETAWDDIYTDNDGWIDSNESNRGRIDVGVGLYGGDVDSLSWLTGIGIGGSEDAAVSNAVSVVDSGYESEREKYIPWS